MFVNHYGIAPVNESAWPKNVDVQWRLVALARSLSLPMPRPFQAPYIPGLTVLIPHYGESIILRQRELWWEDKQGSSADRLAQAPSWRRVQELSFAQAEQLRCMCW